ncbi:MAG: iron-containing alcohol dehydrogenase [Beijerinckiaceae bacterium]
MTPFVFNTTPSIVFGTGSALRLGALVKPGFGKRVLVVTDAGIIKAGLLEGALESLTAADIGWSIYSAVTADPPEALVLDALRQARDFEATGVIGLGGGSSLDVAKLVALLAASGEKLADIYGVGLAKGPRLPLALVPTTAGTGSEVTPISIITTGASEKKGVVSPVILPDIAILDAELTLGLPAAVTAATGVDAMVHAIEAITSTNANHNPVSRALAFEALRLLGGNIRTAVFEGANRDARGAMLLGSLLAGQAFANSPVAAVHALAYPIGGHFHVPHGLSNALVLPHVLAFNAPAAQQHYADIAPVLFPALAGKNAAEACSGLIQSLITLAQEIGLPLRLRDVDIPEHALPMLAADAMKQTRLLVNNPRPVQEADALAIYRAAW